MTFILLYMNVAHCNNWFVNVELSLHHCHPTCWWCMTLFIYCWIQLANIFLRIFFSSYIHQRSVSFSLSLFFFFFCSHYLILDIWVMVASEWIWECSLFNEIVLTTGSMHSSYVGRIPLWSHQVLDFCLISLLITNLMTQLVRSPSDCLFLPDSVLENSKCQVIYLFSPILSNFLTYITVCNILIWFLISL